MCPSLGFQNTLVFLVRSDRFYSKGLVKYQIFHLGPSLKTARYGHSCGILKWFNPFSDRLEDIVVVAGGFNGRVLTSVEYLYVDNIDFGFLYGPGDPYIMSYLNQGDLN